MSERLIAELDACTDHHINNSSFSYRRSSGLTYLCPTVHTQAVGIRQIQPCSTGLCRLLHEWLFLGCFAIPA